MWVWVLQRLYLKTLQLPLEVLLVRCELLHRLLQVHLPLLRLPLKQTLLSWKAARRAA